MPKFTILLMPFAFVGVLETCDWPRHVARELCVSRVSEKETTLTRPVEADRSATGRRGIGPECRPGGAAAALPHGSRAAGSARLLSHPRERFPIFVRLRARKIEPMRPLTAIADELHRICSPSLAQSS